MMGHKWNMVPMILRQANPCFESLVFEIVFFFEKIHGKFRSFGCFASAEC